MVRLRNTPFGALLNELDAVGGEFVKMCNGRPTGAGNLVPPVNVWADDNAVYLETDLPGVDPATLDIQLTEGNQLSIVGERQVTDVADGWVRRERAAGQFARSLVLPSLVDADKVEATFVNGVLRLTLPKVEAVKPKRIAVK